MTSLAVGVAVHAEPQQLRNTVEALAASTGGPLEVLLLPDGPDAETATALANDALLADLPQLAIAGPWGGPACFNRLIAATSTDVVVLLESGAQVAANALALLVAAVTDPAWPTTGLAGPSTNRAWNEQRALAHGTGGPLGLAAGANELRARFGDQVRELKPLYSLGDFCFAVRRDVIDAVGAADEGFGMGPCWEMEYNARAARSGFRGVWVGSAYVHRSPFTARRQLLESSTFAASRRHYQDRLCGLRMENPRRAYSLHCEGDACPHFAPAGRIEIRVPLKGSRSAPFVTSPPSQLVSCVMVTADRPQWAAQSISYFQQQDHPARELVIVDDGDQDLRLALGPLMADPRITYVRTTHRTSIGQKRNLGCERAQGGLVAQWDDDDWYGCSRLSDQLAPLLHGSADISALRDAVWFDIDQWRFRRPSPSLHRSLFVEDVHGGTLVYRRSIWDRGVRYPNSSLAEDAWFLRAAIRNQARLVALPAAGRYVYIRHGTNSWRLDPVYANRPDWEDLPEPAELCRDRAFYASRSSAAPVERLSALNPAVSCIMPTADRRQFVPTAVECFLGQEFTGAELLVVDDGDDPVADLLPADPRVRYVRLDRREVLGTKRNLCVEAADGAVIVHWDDDDWSHPDRLAVQSAALAERIDVCGLDRMLWWNPLASAAWRYVCPPGRRHWVAGNTLAYTRSAWRRSPFPSQAAGEDSAFLWSRADLRVRALGDERLVVGTVHPGNSSPKDPADPSWQSIDIDEVRALLGSAAARAGSAASAQ